MFRIVEISNKNVFEDDLIPHSLLGRAASYEPCPLFKYGPVLVFAKYTDVFKGDFLCWGGGGKGLGGVGGSFHGVIFHGGK